MSRPGTGTLVERGLQLRPRTASFARKLGLLIAAAALTVPAMVGLTGSAPAAPNVPQIGPGSANTAGVTCIQKALGIDPTPAPYGTFGHLTYNAVKEFQSQHGLPRIGAVGPATGDLLIPLAPAGCAEHLPSGGSNNPTQPTSTDPNDRRSYPGCPLLLEGDQSTCVERLQHDLNLANSSYDLPKTGFFGVLTRTAVLDFQGRHGLPADGNVGGETADLLADQAASNDNVPSPGPGTSGASPAPPQVSEAFSNRVATFNVCNPNPCDRSAEAIAAEVAKYKPQVVGFQEICVRQTNRVREVLEENYGLKYYVQHGSVLERWSRCGGTPWDGGNFGNAILSASPISDPIVEEYRAGGSEDRGYVAVTTEVAGEPVRVFNTHLAQADQNTVRENQAQHLARNASQHGRTIVLGDFNATPDARELQPMWSVFRDADPNCAPPANSNCKLTHPGANKKFDYIFLSTDYTPRGVESHDNYSDHNFVHADLF